MTPKRDTLATTTLVFLLFVLAVASTASTYSMEDEDSHHLSKRSYFDINCKGLYDKSIFARLDRICQDCYSLYREPELHTLCRSQCFSTPFFKACLKVLLLDDVDPMYDEMIDTLGR